MVLTGDEEQWDKYFKNYKEFLEKLGIQRRGDLESGKMRPDIDDVI